jgi:alanine racemase
MNQKDGSFELGFEIPISREEFFTKFWQTAINELGIIRIQNGTELRKEQLESTLMELEQLRKWAQSNLLNNDLEYMVSRIDLLIKELPSAFKTDDTVLWIG